MVMVICIRFFILVIICDCWLHLKIVVLKNAIQALEFSQNYLVTCCFMIKLCILSSTEGC